LFWILALCGLVGLCPHGVKTQKKSKMMMMMMMFIIIIIIIIITAVKTSNLTR
jgi:hypothetical protein